MDRSQITFTIFLLLIFILGIIKIPTSNAQSNEKKSDVKLEDDVGKAQKRSKTDDEVVLREEEAINIDGLNVAQIKELRKKAERFSFQADVDRMMKLIINSLYKNKEVFLRELISNASDALDRLRLQALTSSINTEDLVVKIRADNNTRLLHIFDTGIGMTKKDLIDNLGTIAKSGTSEFLSKLAESKSTSDANDLIGQFGVGFYSAFLVADRVTVISKHDDDPNQHIWESDSNSFSIAVDPRGPTLKRGTEVILHLKEETSEYLGHEKLKSLIDQYSQFINFPIYIWDSTQRIKRDVKKDERSDVVLKDEDVIIEDGSKISTNEMETVWDWLPANVVKPIWRRSPPNITKEQYDGFYNSITKLKEKPLAKIHFTVEGDVAFRSLLFVPSKAPANFYRNLDNHEIKIKMYVKGVFVTDKLDDLIPNYLKFVVGVLDSDDLPLNISRETLQQNKLLKVINKKLVHKILTLLKNLSAKDYEIFWNEFSTGIKLGIIRDASNRKKLSKLLKFWSSHDSKSMIFLSDYVSRMKEKQDVIYYIVGQSLDELKKSPFVENVLKKGFEVVYMIDAMDEYLLQSLQEFDGKDMQNLAKEGLEIGYSEEDKHKKKMIVNEFRPLTKWLSDIALKDYIDRAEISERLHSSPCVIIAKRKDWTGNTERVSKSEMCKGSGATQEPTSVTKKILEINAYHPLIKELKKLVQFNATDVNAKEIAMIIYETAVIRSGYSLSNNEGFAERIQKIWKEALNISVNEQVDDDLHFEMEAPPLEDEGLVEEPISREDIIVNEEESSKADDEL